MGDTMGILMSTKIKEQITNELKNCTESVQVITAFCKLEGLRFYEKNLNTNLTSKKLLVRFRMDDILSGATDLEIYNFCKEYNWELYIQLDLHAKTYIFDNKRCIIGSANLTNSGLGLDRQRNLEISYVTNLAENEANAIERLFQNSTRLNDDLFYKMQCEIKQIDQLLVKGARWSKDIEKELIISYDVLFVNDFPKYNSFESYREEEIEFLDLKRDWTFDEIKMKFHQCKAFRWLVLTLSENGNEMYFGAIVTKLQSILINDPKPYRKEVKVLLSNLLQWIQDFEMEDIKVDQPRYSQRVRII